MDYLSGSDPGATYWDHVEHDIKPNITPHDASPAGGPRWRSVGQHEARKYAKQGIHSLIDCDRVRKIARPIIKEGDAAPGWHAQWKILPRYGGSLFTPSSPDMCRDLPAPVDRSGFHTHEWIDANSANFKQPLRPPRGRVQAYSNPRQVTPSSWRHAPDV